MKGIVKYGEFEKITDILDSLDNKFLKLDGYTHIKGIIKTVSSPDPFIKESKIERKHKARDQLMEALVDIYALIYEDYFGRFTFQDIDSLGKKKTGTLLDAGRFFRLQYETTAQQIEFQNGIRNIQKIIDTINLNDSKFKYIDLNFLLNYLPEYSGHKDISSAEDFIVLFNNQETIEDFFEYLFQKFSNSKLKENLKKQLNNFYNGMIDYIRGKTKRKPTFKQDLKMFKDEVITVFKEISENINDNNKSWFYEGKGADKNHPAKKYNMKRLPRKKIDLLLDTIAEMEHLLHNDINLFKKAFSHIPLRIRTSEEIVQQVSNDLKIDLKNEIEKYGLSEEYFEVINRINVMALLNTDEYEVPHDIKMNLIFEGCYDKDSVKSLIEASSKISEMLRLNMSDVIKTDPLFNDILNMKIVADKANGEILELSLKLPKSILRQNRNKIFGPNAVWDPKDKSVLKGFKLPFDMVNKDTFGQAMRSDVFNSVRRELKPIINFMNKYSREIHSGFDEVSNKLLSLIHI